MRTEDYIRQKLRLLYIGTAVNIAGFIVELVIVIVLISLLK